MILAASTRQAVVFGRPGPVFAILWVTSLILGPFYLLPSGLPQIGDVLAILVAAGVLLRVGWRTAQPFAVPAILLICFVWYVFLVDFGWVVATGRSSIVLKPLYYAFNLLIFLTLLALYSRAGRDFLRLTIWGVSLSVFIQVILSFAMPQESATFRQSLFFNNPNQLGYFALLSTAIFAYGCQSLKIHPLHQLLFFPAAFYLTILSLSKAAIIGTAILCLFLFTRKPLLGLALTSLVVFWFYAVPAGQETRTDLGRRFASVGVHEDDSWAGRGYDRIAFHPELLFWGAGEGGYERFESQLAGTEMHSSWGTVLFSYGIPGSALFLLFLGYLFVQSGIYSLLYFLPVTFYGLTHNGIRFTLLWVFLAFLLCAAHEARRASLERRTTGGADAEQP
jgi:hypothetical protein